MKYKIIALSLFLLASSAFASASFPSDDELDKLASDIHKIFSTISTKKNVVVIGHFNDSNLIALNLTENQKNKLLGLDIRPITDKNIFFAKLKEVRDEELQENVDIICDAAGGKNVSLGDPTTYGGKLTATELDDIRSFETNTGGWPLTRDDIENYIRSKTLPTPLPRVEKILKIADGGKISDKDASLYGVDLDTTQYQTIEKFETLSGRAVTETELSDYLDNGILLPFTVDQRLDAIKALPAGKVGETTEIKGFATAKQIQVIIAKEAEFNGRIADDLLEKILKATNDTELDELAKPIDVPPPALPETNSEKVAFILALTAPDVKLTGIDKSLYREVVGDKEIAAIAAKENETGKKITDSELLFILTNPASSDEAESTGEPEPTRTNTAEDLATKVFAHAKNGKFEEASRPALLELGVTEAQINKLIATAGLDTKEKVDAVLKSATESNPEAATTTTPASAAADVSTQILNLALGNTKQLDATKHEAALKNLNLSEEVIKALLAAKDLDTKEKIDEILKSAAAAPSSAPKVLTPAEIAAEIFKNFIKNEKVKSDDASKEFIKKLGITDSQLEKLLAADKLDSAAKIEDLLKAKTESPTGKTGDVSSENDDANAQTEAKESWYTNPWLLGIGGVLVLAAIGGGAYIMTRKTDETDL